MSGAGGLTPGAAEAAVNDAVGATRVRVRFPLTWRVFLGTALVVAAILAGTLLLTARAAERAAASTAERGIAAIRSQVTAHLDGDARGLLEGARVFAQNPAFRSLVAGGARSDALDQSREAAERLHATWVQVTDAAGGRLAKSDAPDAPPEPLGGMALIGRALGGEPVAAFGVDEDGGLFHAVAVPVEGATPGKRAGVLMATRRLDAAAARAIGAASGGDVVFYVSDAAGIRVTASTLAATPELRAAVATLGRAALGNTPPPTVALGGERFYGLATPLRSADGRPLGGVAVLHSQTAELRPFRDLERTIVLAGLAALALALPVSFGIARQITRPLAQLVAAARRAAAGDYSTDSGVRSRDEVGVLAEAFGTMLADLREKQVLVEFARLTPPRASRATTPSTPVPTVRRRLLDESTARVTRDVPPNETEAEAHAPAEATDAFAAAAALRPGQLFARRYTIHHMIGAGGAGVVFKATDTTSGETIALKVLRPDVLRNDPVSIDRLAREVDIARRLSQPNIVQVYGLGQADGQHFITMEYVEGSSLREIIDERGTLPAGIVVTLGKQLCRALDHAHARGVVHRDVKPHNLVVTPAGVLKVMDFGTARLTETTRGLTESGVLFGTPAYMAPELLRSGSVDARADIYSTGVVLYEALVGRPPFVGTGSALAVLTQALESPPPDPASLNPSVPRALADVVLRTLEKNAVARPQSAAELESLLSEAAVVQRA